MKNQATQHKAGGSVGAFVHELRAAGHKVTPLLQMTLVHAARRCNQFNDSPEARAAMKRAVLDTPAELLADLHEALSPVVVEMGAADESTTNERD
ncbi:hypothetical protein [Diaphorobacter caeni]|uniref:hypothetical protein n=1 Tax=Diaphorobacter caeni TaxID=2784387 RepID=UPI0018901DBB|nr:hypothetical protein [Diaphorobacter caeni]MBF5006974.1 hypothetical protein [Diaphorobacter caeni]